MGGHTVYGRMQALLTCTSQPEYMELCRLLMSKLRPLLSLSILIYIAHEDDNIKRWAKHKKNEVIAAGLNKHCSLIDPQVYDRLRDNTNAAEQSANKSYSLGKKQDLLPAVLRYIQIFIECVLNLF